MKSFATASIVAAAAALTLAATAPAATIALNSYTSTAAFPSDTRLNGSATNDATTIDGTHSTVKLVSTDGIDGNEKVAPFFSTGSNAAIGTLGDLGRGGLTADWKLASRGANTASFVYTIAAFRLLVDGPTPGTFAEIIWESPNQTPVPTYTAGVGYDNVDIGSGKFYARYLSANYGEGSTGPVNNLTLAQIASGAALTPSPLNPIFSDGTKVYGVQVAVGSAAGDYTAYVGDINATFTSIPEPAALAVFGLGATGLLMRRRQASRA